MSGSIINVRTEWTKCVACQSPTGELCVSIDLDTSLCQRHWTQVLGVAYRQERAIARCFADGIETDLTGEAGQ